MGRIIGIELGASSCRVQVHDERLGVVVPIPSRDGESSIPAVVAWVDGEFVVGARAKRRQVFDPTTVVTGIRDSLHKSKPLRLAGREHAPAEVAAHIFEQAKELSESYLGEDVTGAVFAVPPALGGTAKEAWERAAGLAGLDVAGLVPVPVAAAIAFGLVPADTTREIDVGAAFSSVVVCDLGATTFDVALVEIDGPNSIIMSIAGDHHLGGDDFDRAIVDWLLRLIEEEHGVDLRSPRASADFSTAYHRVRAEAERVKLALDSQSSATVMLPSLFRHQARGTEVHVEHRLGRDEFHLLIAAHLATIRRSLHRVLEGTFIGPSEIDKVLLVGGGTRLPRISTLIEEHFGQAPLSQANPDRTVARGVALRARGLEEAQGAPEPDPVREETDGPSESSPPIALLSADAARTWAQAQKMLSGLPEAGQRAMSAPMEAFLAALRSGNKIAIEQASNELWDQMFSWMM